MRLQRMCNDTFAVLISRTSHDDGIIDSFSCCRRTQATCVRVRRIVGAAHRLKTPAKNYALTSRRALSSSFGILFAAVAAYRVHTAA